MPTAALNLMMVELLTALNLPSPLFNNIHVHPFRANILFVLLYKSSTWILTTTMVGKLQQDRLGERGSDLLSPATDNLVY